jgi:hypothetical protein
VHGSFWGLKKFKMAAVAMVTKGLMKGIQFFLNPPFIASMATAAKFVLPIPIFMAYLVPLDVDVTGNITAKICEANFIKLCRNIHRSAWQFLGVEKIQNGSRCHGNQGAKNVK